MTPKDDLFEQNDGKDEASGSTGSSSDANLSSPEEQQPEPYTGETPGEILRAAREAKGLSTQQVADSLRLRNTVVEMIEADQYDKLSSPTYVRGYLRSFSKALEVDEKRVFEAYRAMGYGEVAASTITMQSFSKRKVRERNDSRLMLISYLIIAIVLAMAVVWWWQETNASSSVESFSEQVFGNNQVSAGNESDAAEPNNNNANSSARTPISRRVTEMQPVTLSEADVRSELNDDATSDDASSAENNQEATVVDASGGAQASNISSNETTAPEARLATSGNATSGTVDNAADNAAADLAAATDTRMGSDTSTAADRLVMTFSDACWVKVTDGNGEVIAIGTKVAGYTMPLSGQAPFDIILCKPEAVSMTYNGEQVDLSGYRRSRSVTMTLN